MKNTTDIKPSAKPVNNDSIKQQIEECDKEINKLDERKKSLIDNKKYPPTISGMCGAFAAMEEAQNIKEQKKELEEHKSELKQQLKNCLK